MAQTHGNEIAVVDQQGMTPSADGLVTANKDIALAVRVADCLPLLLLSKAGCGCSACWQKRITESGSGQRGEKNARARG